MPEDCAIFLNWKVSPALLRGDLRDTMIAGLVLANHAILAARNVSHFAELSVPVVNPWAD